MSTQSASASGLAVQPEGAPVELLEAVESATSVVEEELPVELEAGLEVEDVLASAAPELPGSLEEVSSPPQATRTTARAKPIQRMRP